METSSCGVCRECLPRPPQTWTPSSCSNGASPRFRAPITLVVMPEECPIHAHHGAERLEPERVSETAQQFVTAIMIDNRFADHRPEAGHPVGEPPRNLSSVQRQVGGSSPLGHQSSVL